MKGKQESISIKSQIQGRIQISQITSSRYININNISKNWFKAIRTRNNTYQNKIKRSISWFKAIRTRNNTYHNKIKRSISWNKTHYIGKISLSNRKVKLKNRKWKNFMRLIKSMVNSLINWIRSSLSNEIIERIW